MARAARYNAAVCIMQRPPEQGATLLGAEGAPDAQLLLGVRELGHMFPVEAIHDCPGGTLRFLQLPDALSLFRIEPPEPALQDWTAT